MLATHPRPPFSERSAWTPRGGWGVWRRRACERGSRCTEGRGGGQKVNPLPHGGARGSEDRAPVRLLGRGRGRGQVASPLRETRAVEGEAAFGSGRCTSLFCFQKFHRREKEERGPFVLFYMLGQLQGVSGVRKQWSTANQHWTQG